MELRHLDALLAIADEGSFTAAADTLATVQSNVSEQVRQLEGELGAQLLIRSRRGATPTECGDVVLDRARRIRRELEAMRTDLATVQGLETGDASFGIVGTASRWVVPALVAEMRQRARGVRLLVVEAASERLMAEVAGGELAQAVVTEPVSHPHLYAETLLEEALVAVVPAGTKLPPPPVPFARCSSSGSCSHLPRTRCARRSIWPRGRSGSRCRSPSRSRGSGSSPTSWRRERVRRSSRRPRCPPSWSIWSRSRSPTCRRGASRSVTARDTNLSLADQALRECLLGVVDERRRAPGPVRVARR